MSTPPDNPWLWFGGFPVVDRKQQRKAFVQCQFAGPKDLRLLKEFASSDSESKVAEAAEFARLAAKRWSYYRRQSLVATDIEDLCRRVAADPSGELSVLLVARIEDRLLGCCHFRRTWAGNVYIDFLAAPALQDFTGTGTGLLFYVSCIAAEIGANQIWGEATRDSCGFYEKTFSCTGVDDLFRIPNSSFVRFRDRFLEKWRHQTDGLRNIQASVDPGLQNRGTEAN
jgi:hypothetical protein